jgi:hypothetical protein
MHSRSSTDRGARRGPSSACLNCRCSWPGRALGLELLPSCHRTNLARLSRGAVGIGSRSSPPWCWLRSDRGFCADWTVNSNRSRFQCHVKLVQEDKHSRFSCSPLAFNVRAICPRRKGLIVSELKILTGSHQIVRAVPYPDSWFSNGSLLFFLEVACSWSIT